MRGLILVTGSEGLIGSRFVELYPQKKFLHYPKQVELDITNKNQVKKILKKGNFTTIVNFAAYTDVGASDNERGDKQANCWRVNVEGTKNLVNLVDPKKTHFIQISTDMVFSGDEDNPGPYSEDFQPEEKSEKLTWYGFTKAEAERLVLAKLGKNATVLRFNYPVRSDFELKLDFLRKPLSLYDQGELYPLFDDQQISITFIDDACRVLEKIISEEKKGIFHASSRDTTTPFEVVSYLLRKVRGEMNTRSLSLDDFIKRGNDSRRYPKYGGLKVEETEKVLEMKFSTWREIVDKLIEQGLGHKRSRKVRLF
jgi:dTDP-4-dehydrorhamnose reductase